MSRRGLTAVAAAAPVVGLLGLMAWALVQTGGNPGGVGINNVFGEVSVEEGPAPSFALPLLNGETVSLADFKGKVVMLDFWSSWCPPCIEEAPALAAAYPQYADKGVEFLGVAIWDEEREVRRHVERYNVPYPNGLDEFGKTAMDYGVRGIPEKFFIDLDGMLVRKFIGPVSLDRLQEIMSEILGGEGDVQG